MELNWSALTEPSFLIWLSVGITLYALYLLWEKQYKKGFKKRCQEKNPRDAYETRKMIEYYTKEEKKQNRKNKKRNFL